MEIGKADATALSNDIRTAGHAAVYGILFDPGKSTVKPELHRLSGKSPSF